MQSINWQIGGEADLKPKGESGLDLLSSVECIVWMANKPYGVRTGQFNFKLKEWFLQGVGGTHDPEKDDIYYAPINLPF